MSNGQKFFICRHCGNLIGLIFNKGVPLVCCGEQMEVLVPNTSDGAGEKHVPVITVSGNKVSVDIGSVEHPMTDEHHIEWVYLETKSGGQRKSYFPGNKPHVEFVLTDDDEVISAFEYCNLHGLWMAKA